jgi:transposase
VAFHLAPGHLPEVPTWVVADRGYTSHALREHIWSTGSRLAIPPHQHEAPVACPIWIYNNRNQVERLWARLKEWRAVAARYEKTARSFLSVLCLAASLNWIKS